MKIDSKGFVFLILYGLLAAPFLFTIFSNNTIVKFSSTVLMSKSRTILKQSHDCSSVSNWLWQVTNRPILPLLGCAWTEENRTKAMHKSSRCDENGYVFTNNRFGTTHVFPIRHLKYTLFSPQCKFQIFKPNEKALFLRNKLWIHLEGDSVMRDNYYDFKEYFTNTYSIREKIMQNTSFSVNDTLVSFSCNIRNFSTGCNTLVTWKLFRSQYQKPYPDVWIYNSGLHDIQHFLITNETYKNKLKCLTEHVHAKTLALFKLTTPIANLILKQKRFGLNRIKELNNIAVNTLDQSIWKVIDVWEMLNQRKNELTTDGIHYTGIGSKWTANIILDVIQKHLKCTEAVESL